MIMDLCKDLVTMMSKTWIHFNVQYKTTFIDCWEVKKRSSHQAEKRKVKKIVCVIFCFV